MALNHRQQCFIYEYLNAPSNAAEAARKAGYSPFRAKVTACELLKKPDIIEEIQNAQEEHRKRASFDRDTAADLFLGVIYDADTPNHSKIQAIKELGKLLGLYPSQKAA